MSWFSSSSNQPPAAPPPQRLPHPSQPPSQQRHHLPSSYQHSGHIQKPQYDPYEKRAPAYSAQPRQQPPPPPARGTGGGGGGAGRFAVVEAPSPSHALANRIVLNQQDWGNTPYVLIKGNYVYAT
ncbi:hypothetical protein JCM8547_001578, partial [Rhodosporidiobolus lusitaniae]